jgi:hypothetical protein
MEIPILTPDGVYTEPRIGDIFAPRQGPNIGCTTCGDRHGPGEPTR